MRSIDVSRVTVEEVTLLRELHRQEMNCQIVHDSFPRRGFDDAYLIRVEGRTAGYGLVANRYYPDTVDEFYTVPECRFLAQRMFRELLDVSHATRIRCQSNDRLMLLMLYDFATDIARDAVLFEDGFASHLSVPDGRVRKVDEADKPLLLELQLDTDSEWMLESEGAPVATGGLLFHYNPPYGDIYMQVKESDRRRGFGSYLVQELKRIAYAMGKIPAARCDVTNEASRRTLERAGMLPCGGLLEGAVKK